MKGRLFVWREERFWFRPKTGHWSRQAFWAARPFGQLHSIAAQCAVSEEGGAQQHTTCGLGPCTVYSVASLVSQRSMGW